MCLLLWSDLSDSSVRVSEHHHWSLVVSNHLHKYKRNYNICCIMWIMLSQVTRTSDACDVHNNEWGSLRMTHQPFCFGWPHHQKLSWLLNLVIFFVIEDTLVFQMPTNTFPLKMRIYALRNRYAFHCCYSINAWNSMFIMAQCFAINATNEKMRRANYVIVKNEKMKVNKNISSYRRIQC